jgi:hypothetical protein
LPRAEATDAEEDCTTVLIGAATRCPIGSPTRRRGFELQKLADELGVPITVCHLPPGTSKWNKIEHRLFSFVTGNWRGKPLVSHKVIVQLIAATTTNGLQVRCDPHSKATDNIAVQTAVQAHPAAIHRPSALHLTLAGRAGYPKQGGLS